VGFLAEQVLAGGVSCSLLAEVRRIPIEEDLACLVELLIVWALLEVTFSCCFLKSTAVEMSQGFQRLPIPVVGGRDSLAPDLLPIREHEVGRVHLFSV